VQQTVKWVAMCAELLLPVCLFVDVAALVGHLHPAGDAGSGAGAAAAWAASGVSGGRPTIGMRGAQPDTRHTRSRSPAAAARDGRYRRVDTHAPAPAAGTTVPPGASPGPHLTLAEVEAEFAEVLLPYWGAPQCKESRVVLEHVVSTTVHCIVLLSVRYSRNTARVEDANTCSVSLL